MASNHSSQRSRVKGTLEVYHAYISDSSTIENEDRELVSDSDGWELVQAANNSPEEQAADVRANKRIVKFVNTKSSAVFLFYVFIKR